MFTNLFLAVVIGFCLGFLFRAFVMPAYWKWEAEQKEREKYKISKSVKRRNEIGDFLSKIEERLLSAYNVSGVISKELLSEFNSYIYSIGQNQPFNHVCVEWVGNKETFTINVNIDGQEFILSSLWDIRNLSEEQKENWSPVFVPVVLLPE